MSPTPSQSFPASYDSTAKLISAVVCGVWIVIAFIAGNLLIAGLGALTVVLAYAWSPSGYSVSNRSIVVHRLIGDVRIPLDTIREARPAASDDFCGSIRLFGSGGMFGYWGLFRTATLGKSTWHLTNRRHAIVIFANKTYLISPDDVDGFLAVIRTSAPVSPATAAAPFGSAPATGGGIATRLITLAVAALVILVVLFAFLYSPGPPNYTLTKDSLAIHDRFYPVKVSATQVDVPHICVIDLDSDRQWRPVTRTNGFANSHYRSGHFRVAGGQDVRLYQAQSRKLVLLPAIGKGTAILLETRDPAAFAAQLRSEWSGPLISQPSHS